MRHSSKARQSVSPEFGRSLAASALAFLAADPERLDRFAGLTGLGPHNLRQAAKDPAFLDSVLEYMLGDEELLLAVGDDEVGGRPADVAVLPECFELRDHVGVVFEADEQIVNHLRPEIAADPFSVSLAVDPAKPLLKLSGVFGSGAAETSFEGLLSAGRGGTRFTLLLTAVTV